MKYLHDQQHYIDLYDLQTIRSCIDIIKVYREKIAPELSSPDLKDISPKEKERSLN